MSVTSAAIELRRQAIALRNGHAGTKKAVAEGLLRLADSLEDPAHDIDPESIENMERLADQLIEAWDAIRHHVPAGGPLADACLEAAGLLRPSNNGRDRG